MKKCNLFFLSFLFLSLSACSYIKGAPTGLRKSDSEYLQAQSIPKLKTPKGYSELNYQDRYPIPNQHEVKGSARVSLTPPDDGK